MTKNSLLKKLSKINQNKVKNLIGIIYKNILKIFAGSGLRRIEFIKNIDLFLRIKLTPNFIITNKYNHKMFLDKLDSLNLSVNKNWESFETSLLEKEIKEGDIVLDLGANIGFYTLIMAQLVGKKGRVYAFEADLTNFEILRKNIEINGYKNVILENKAVLDKNEIVKFYINKGNTAGNSLFQGEVNTTYKAKKYNEVQGIRLDNYFKDKRIDFIKIDIEGAEYKATKGMLYLLNKNRNIKIMTEFYPMLIRGVGEEDDYKTYLKILDKLNFKLYDIKEDTKSLVLLSSKEILDKYGGMLQYTNLFCKRK